MPKVISLVLLNKIKIDYEARILNINDLCKKYKISFNTLQKYAKQNYWQRDGIMPINDVIGYKSDQIKEIVETSIQELQRVDNDIEKAKTKIDQDIHRANKGLKFLEDLKTKIERNLLLAEQMTQELLEKPTVSKTVIIDTTIKGIKKITETRSLDGHEKSSIAKIVFDKYKTLYHQQEPQAPAVVINNNNQQMQVSEALKQDLQDLNERLISANIDNLTDEN